VVRDQLPGWLEAQPALSAVDAMERCAACILTGSVPITCARRSGS